MKKQYNIKDKVWIHLGERRLTEGRVVEIIDFEHLGEGHSPDIEFYVIEIKTGIDDVYEVRSFDQISPDSTGPIGLFRKNKQLQEQTIKGNHYLKKLGASIPAMNNPLVELAEDIQKELDSTDDDDEISPDIIHAAMANSTLEHQHISDIIKPAKPKRKFNNARKAKPKKTQV